MVFSQTLTPNIPINNNRKDSMLTVPTAICPPEKSQTLSAYHLGFVGFNANYVPIRNLNVGIMTSSIVPFFMRCYALLPYIRYSLNFFDFLYISTGFSKGFAAWGFLSNLSGVDAGVTIVTGRNTLTFSGIDIVTHENFISKYQGNFQIFTVGDIVNFDSVDIIIEAQAIKATYNRYKINYQYSKYNVIFGIRLLSINFLRMDSVISEFGMIFPISTKGYAKTFPAAKMICPVFNIVYRFGE